MELVAAAESCRVSPPKSLKIIQLNEVACASALKPTIGSNTLTEQRVIAITTNCIPNGQLCKIYEDKVLSPRKSRDLKIKSGQKIELGNGKCFITDGYEKFKEIKLPFLTSLLLCMRCSM